MRSGAAVQPAGVRPSDCSSIQAPRAQPFSLLVKPTSADCNLRCCYCFYLPKASLYPGTDRHRMSHTTLNRLVRAYMNTDQPVYSFSWQGGEPLLMGVDFFRTAISLEQRYARKGALVSNGVQTNATLVTKEIAELFARFQFLVGVSLDGLPEVHDAYRRSASGAESHARVLGGIATLRAHGVPVNALVAVSAANVHRPLDTYRYLCGQGIFFHQYIPIVEHNADGRSTAFSINGPEWGDFLCTVFDAWLPDAHAVSVRTFDAVVSSLLGDEPVALCTMGSDCREYLVVEYNGDVYPCDFFVQPEWQLGNLRAVELLEMTDSPRRRIFGTRKAAVSVECTACDYLPLCGGDCPKDRVAWSVAPMGRSVLCEGWRQFYAHALPRLTRMARKVQRARMPEWRIS